jgi:predicted amino acid racemase
MAYITLNAKKLKDNYTRLDKLFTKEKIQWAVVTKLLCGNRTFLQEVINLGTKQLCDSRVSNLKSIKQLAPDIETIYIKPPPARSIPEIVRYADISLNTELRTLRLISNKIKSTR